MRQILSWTAIVLGTLLFTYLNVIQQPWSLLLPLLIWTAYTDAKHRIIPNTVPFILVLYGFCRDPHIAVGGLVGCFFIFLPLYALGGMGAGDVKLAASVGAVLGYYHGVEVIMCSCVIALIYLTCEKLKKRQFIQWVKDSFSVIKTFRHLKLEMPESKEDMLEKTVPLGTFFLPAVVVLWQMNRGG